MNLIWAARGAMLALLLALGWAAGAGLRGRHAEAWPPRSPRIRVLTTIFPLYDFARNTGGADVALRNLLPPGVDPHEFSLSPRDAQMVAGADLILANGGGLDDFILQAARKAGVPEERIVRVAPDDAAMLRAEGEVTSASGRSDPHRWLDPVLARVYVRRIGSAIIALTQPRDRQAALRIRARESGYQRELAALDSDYATRLAPFAGRAFISFHGAFNDLARRYGLRVAAVWQSVPGRQPAPREVGSILRSARKNGVRALFSEPQFSPRALEIIGHDAGLPVYPLDPVETTERFDRAGYLPAMRRNLDTLVRALGGT